MGVGEALSGLKYELAYHFRLVANLQTELSSFITTTSPSEGVSKDDISLLLNFQHAPHSFTSFLKSTNFASPFETFPSPAEHHMLISNTNPSSHISRIPTISSLPYSPFPPLSLPIPSWQPLSLFSIL